VLVKPDGVQRGLTGEIISRFERRGLRLVAAKFMNVNKELAEAHYAEHKGKVFYNGLITYITSGPVMAMVWEGTNGVLAIRQTVGATKPWEAAPGTIRHDLAIEMGRNLVHASDKVETGVREAELVNWTREADKWIYE
jgi:nucleoside-diphosphate kinase